LLQIVSDSQRLLLIQSLETQTEYEIFIQAENDIGKSCRESVRCSTMAKPPEPPDLTLAQATANTLKLKWNIPGGFFYFVFNIFSIDAQATNYYYYLERENENGSYSPIYEVQFKFYKLYLTTSLRVI
jgi:hypothetical protein